jgi:hypothetical protein
MPDFPITSKASELDLTEGDSPPPRLKDSVPPRIQSPSAEGRIEHVVRQGRVLVDWRQNDPMRSIVAPYSLRARPRPVISAPLSWEEVEEATGRPEA